MDGPKSKLRARAKLANVREGGRGFALLSSASPPTSSSSPGTGHYGHYGLFCCAFRPAVYRAVGFCMLAGPLAHYLAPFFFSFLTTHPY